MKKLIFSLIFLSYLTPSFGQSGKMDAGLTKKLQTISSDNELVRVVLVMSDHADIATLHADFVNSKSAVDYRAKKVLRELTLKAVQSQQSVVDAMNKYSKLYPNSYENLRQHWIANIMVVSLRKGLIEELAQNENISKIEWDSSRLVLPIVPVEQRSGSARIAGGTEPGVKVINAPALWKMGYTGRGRLHYSFDTGAWPDHPAIGERFLGKHFPLSQSFFSLDNETLKDKTGSHGTHTLGTALGLDNQTGDTIGVAFNAYWIANDLIATSLATVKPLSEFVSAFEWAFNPDGDTATTSDIPDVINNSWGYTSPGDTALCNSYVSEMLSALEAAGIATIFSAGNDGPNPNTISEPHHINTGLVNVFTTGSINPHDSTYPISSFSSRGPTTCPGTGSLKIKPEITAPGQNVRSANGPDGYGEKSGTSMASPHVSGALLLLKEAFPYLAGEELMLALYYSARDLGEPGEDNTYGMGLIDVLAAFNWLAERYDPVPPISSSWDLAVEAITEPGFLYACYTSFQPEISMANNGLETITEATLDYGYVGESLQSYLWTGSLLPGESLTLQLPQLDTDIRGDKELLVISRLPEEITEADINNNRRVARFNLREERQLPYFEGFENGTLRNQGWFVENPDESRTWDTMNTGGLANSMYSAVMPFYAYTSGSRQTDVMISQLITLPDTGALTLSFDVAYRLSHPLYADTLQVLLSTDCGNSFPVELFRRGGSDLVTSDTLFEPFVPADSTQWKTLTADISAFAGMDILLNFTGINGMGNNLFVDNITITTPPDPDAISTIAEKQFIVYPNPANTVIHLVSKVANKGDVEMSMVNTAGARTFLGRFQDNQPIDIQVSAFPAGAYLLLISRGSEMETHKLFIYR